MTNKKEVAQKVIEAYETTYTESGLVAALREVVFQLQYYQCCGDESAEDMVLDARAILDVCDELEALLCDRKEQLEKVNAAMKAVEKLYEENGDDLKRLAEIEMEEYTDEQIKQWNEDD